MVSQIKLPHQNRGTNKFFMNKFTVSLLFMSMNFCSAQQPFPDDKITLAEYPAFYNQTVQKLNAVIPLKTTYYGQPLAVFLTKLSQENIEVKSYDPGPYNNKLLTFEFLWNFETTSAVRHNSFVIPKVRIYFQQPYNYTQATVILNNDSHSHWNMQAEQFYKNLIVEKIEFWYVNGINDYDSPPK